MPAGNPKTRQNKSGTTRRNKGMAHRLRIELPANGQAS
jgi:hypothetical protein